VLDLTRHGHPSVRAAALRALAANPTIDAVPHLVEALGHDEPVAVEAIDLLAARNAVGVAPHLVGLLRQPGRRRRQAIRALGRLRAPGCLAALIQLFDAASVYEQIEIVATAAALGGDEALAFLRSRLDTGVAELRQAAAEGLARHAVDTDLPVFTRLAEDQDWPVRSAAAQALARIGGRDAEAALLLLCRDTESLVARAARAGLDRLRSS
jgi:HEAT repeat protein